eukprot:CAMPEP_0185848578 /NCGR_PEP_ID=MMETSP1354-20130828/3404_1 /TAXON_ID=708628 /ORGANISM="Erythrolobus madagascarensis, Strain CCMP3276" /LENGTH=182 /DNA_ID=CAMNT_0028548989 /DNA_START=68 /DNA_END=614 /DNA_ORIENTATION=+
MIIALLKASLIDGKGDADADDEDAVTMDNARGALSMTDGVAERVPEMGLERESEMMWCKQEEADAEEEGMEEEGGDGGDVLFERIRKVLHDVGAGWCDWGERGVRAHDDERVRVRRSDVRNHVRPLQRLQRTPHLYHHLNHTNLHRDLSLVRVILPSTSTRHQPPVQCFLKLAHRPRKRPNP